MNKLAMLDDESRKACEAFFGTTGSILEEWQPVCGFAYMGEYVVVLRDNDLGAWVVFSGKSRSHIETKARAFHSTEKAKNYILRRFGKEVNLVSEVIGRARKKPCKLPPDEQVAQHVKDGMNDAQIAEIYGCTRTAVCMRRKKLGLPPAEGERRNGGAKTNTAEWLRRKYFADFMEELKKKEMQA